MLELLCTNGEPCPPETEADLDSDLVVDRYNFTLFVHRVTCPLPSEIAGTLRNAGQGLISRAALDTVWSSLPDHAMPV